MSPKEALAELRREAGFDDSPEFIETLDLCMWLLAKLHDPALRRETAKKFRLILSTLPVPEYPN
jgi:hypothetical protein